NGLIDDVVLHDGTRGDGDPAGAAVVIDADLQGEPSRVAAADVGAFVDDDGVVGALAVEDATDIPPAPIFDRIIVAEVVVTLRGANPQGIDDDGVAHRVSRRVGEADRHDRGADDDGGVEDAAPADGQVPVAGDEDVAGGGPAVVVGNPHVAGLDACPVAGAPAVRVAVPDPVSGLVKAVGRRRVAGGDVGWRGRLGEVGALLAFALLLAACHRLGGGGPEAGHPLPATVALAPVAGDPLLAGRRDAPHAGDPQKVGAVVVPGPVAADPDDVAVGLFF